jgi:hypothetical protein
LSLKQLQNIINLCFIAQIKATTNIATLDNAVAQAAHSIHIFKPNISIGSKIKFTHQATNVGIIQNFASHTQRKIPVPAIHISINGKLKSTILK